MADTTKTEVRTDKLKTPEQLKIDFIESEKAKGRTAENSQVLKELAENDLKENFGGIPPFLQNEQAFLLDYVIKNPNIFDILKDTQNIALLPKTETTHQFLNKLSIPDEFKKLLDIQASDCARLVPTYEIYKAFYEDGRETNQELFKFHNFSNLSGLDIMDSTDIFRGSDAGIKNVSITLDGKNSATAALVSVKLTLIFQDINTIWKTEKSYKGSEISYTDLLSAPNKIDGSFYRIKMHLGYNGYEDTSLGDVSFRYTKLLLYLDYFRHSIDFKENGMIQVAIEYKGSLERLLSDSDTCNIFSESVAERRIRERDENVIKKLEENKQNILEEIDKKKQNSKFLGELEKTAKKDAIKKAFEEEQSQRKSDELKNELESLKSGKNKLENKILRLLDVFDKQINYYSIDMSLEDIIEYQKFLSSGTSKFTRLFDKKFKVIKGNINKDFSKSIEKPIDQILQSKEKIAFIKEGKFAEDDLKKVAELAVTANNQHVDKKITFVLLGELFECILEKINPIIKQRYNGKNFEILFGKTVFVPPSEDRPYEINIANIPISLTKLNYFLVDKFFGRNVDVYTFQKFFEDLFEDFFKNAIQDAARLRSSYNGPQNIFNIDFLQIYKTAQNYTLNYNPGDKIEKETFFIYSTTTTGKLETFSYSENINNRIPHFFFGGADRGIIKSIKFNNITDAKVKMAIWEANKGGVSNTNDTKQFGGDLTPEIYSVDITAIGFPYINNGNLIFIDTSALGLDKNKGTQILAGGYYTVIKVEHELTEKKFETKINALLHIGYSGKPKEAIILIKENEVQNFVKNEKQKTEIAGSLFRTFDDIYSK